MSNSRSRSSVTLALSRTLVALFLPILCIQLSLPEQTQAFLPATSALRFHFSHLGLVGGDFAGYKATYDLKGRLIPVPEHYVPESLLEWGAEPPALEVLVSEEATENGWTRHELTVLPETGCGVDNLEVLQRTEHVPKWNRYQATSCLSSRYPLDTPAHRPNRTRIETIFDAAATDHRCRLLVDLSFCEDGTWKPETPLTLFLERQTSLISSNGTRADGGGLDGRSVSQWIGRSLRHECDENLGTVETRQWIAEDNPRFDTVSLPGNLTLVFGLSKHKDWTMQVGQVYPSADTCHVVQYSWERKDSNWSFNSLVEKGCFETVNDGAQRTKAKAGKHQECANDLQDNQRLRYSPFKLG